VVLLKEDIDKLRDCYQLLTQPEDADRGKSLTELTVETGRIIDTLTRQLTEKKETAEVQTEDRPERVKWTVSGTTDTGSGKLGDNTALVTADNRLLFIVNTDRKEFICYDLKSRLIVQRLKVPSITGLMSRPVYWNGRIAAADRDLMLIYDIKNSRLVEIPFSQALEFPSELIISPDTLFIPGSRKIFRYDGEKLAETGDLSQSGGQLFASLIGDTLLISDLHRRSFYTFSNTDQKTSDVIQQFKSRVWSAPILFKNRIVITESSGTLWLYDQLSLNKTAEIQLPMKPVGKPIPAGRYLVICTSEGTLYRCDTDKLIVTPFKKKIKVPDQDHFHLKEPAVYGETLIFNGSEGNLLAADAATGEVMSIRVSSVQLAGSPVLVRTGENNLQIIVLDSNGFLYHIEF
jgi:outer membrane protein assembly factor BamB